MNDNRISIRQASPEDAGLILTFIRKLAAFEKRSNEVTNDETTIGKQFFGASPAARAVIAFDEDQPVGFAIYFFTFSSFQGSVGMYVEDIFVDESCRGKGVGGAIMNRLAALAEVQGCKRIELSVLKWNKKAIRFYKSLGAKIEERWDHYCISIDDPALFAE